MANESSTMSQDILELLNKNKPKRRDTVLALVKVAQALEGVTRVMREVHTGNEANKTDLAEHKQQFYSHVEASQERVNKEKGAWKVLLWAMSIIQSMVMVIMFAFWDDYKQTKATQHKIKEVQAAHLAAYPIRKLKLSEEK